LRGPPPAHNPCAQTLMLELCFIRLTQYRLLLFSSPGSLFALTVPPAAALFSGFVVRSHSTACCCSLLRGSWSLTQNRLRLLSSPGSLFADAQAGHGVVDRRRRVAVVAVVRACETVKRPLAVLRRRRFSRQGGWCDSSSPPSVANVRLTTTRTGRRSWRCNGRCWPRRASHGPGVFRGRAERWVLVAPQGE
jgi:hypothetical protein